MESLLGDIRYALRNLLRRPGFTLIAVVTLAVGIGANTAIFSAIHALLLKPLPFPELDRVVAIWDKLPSRGVMHNEVTVANYLDWQSQTQSFDQLALYRWWNANLTGIDPPERIQGFLVTANYLDALGMKPIMGRNFFAEENQPGKDAVAIITHSLWQRRFGGDPNILNKTITINSVVRTVVGVMPEHFNFPKGGEIYAPLPMTPELMKNRNSHGYYVVGRLKSGASIEGSQAEIDNIMARLEQQFPESNKGWGATVFPIVADTVRLYIPTPAAIPFRPHTTGLSSSVIARMIWLAASTDAESYFSWAFSPPRSAPAEKAPPVPVRTTTRTSSRAVAARSCWIAPITISPVSALNCSGRLSVSQRAPSSTLISRSLMGDDLDTDGASGMHALIQDVDSFTVNVVRVAPRERVRLDRWFEHW